MIKRISKLLSSTDSVSSADKKHMRCECKADELQKQGIEEKIKIQNEFLKWDKNDFVEDKIKTEPKKENKKSNIQDNELEEDKITHEVKIKCKDSQRGESELDNSEVESKRKELVDVSVIIPCKNEVSTLKHTVDSIMNSKNTLTFEIIVVDDSSIDSSTQFLEEEKHIYKDVILIKTNSLGAAKTRNAGASIAKGKYLFFCDAHVKVPDYWLDNLVNTLKNYNGDLIAPCIADMYNIAAEGYGQTWDDRLKVVWLMDKPKEGTEIPIACGCAFGITKEAFEKINGFDYLFQVWGKEDEELCFKAWLYGYKIVINPEVKVQHLFRYKHPYKVTAANVTYNMLCFAYSHFRKERIIKAINIAKDNVYFYNISEDIKTNFNSIFSQRKKYIKERKYDDEFFFRKFTIPF